MGANKNAWVQLLGGIWKQGSSHTMVLGLGDDIKTCTTCANWHTNSPYCNSFNYPLVREVCQSSSFMGHQAASDDMVRREVECCNFMWQEVVRPPSQALAALAAGMPH